MTTMPPETGSKCLNKSDVNHQDFIIEIKTIKSSSHWVNVGLEPAAKAI